MYKRSIQGILLMLVVFNGFGCVAQSERDRLNELYRTCEEQNVELRARLEEMQARLKAMQDAGPTTVQDPATLEELAKTKATIAQLQAQLADANERIRLLSSRSALPAKLDSALADFAKAHPDLMTYDKTLGMIKLKSDLTFALGSDTVNQQAAESLRQLADILKSPEASAYEIRVVGHTDNVPIRRPQTLAKHPTNWHLSVHRAIAVKDVFVDAGIPQTRLNVAGYGANRPIAPNGAGGNEANRRVEIYLVTSTYTGQDNPPAPAAAPAPTNQDDGAQEEAAPAPEAFK